MNTPVPVLFPTDPETERILQEEGIPTDGDFRGFWPDNDKQITFGELIDQAMDQYESWSQAMKQRALGEEDMSVWYAIYREAAEDFLSCIGAGNPSDYQTMDPFHMAIAKYDEYDEGIHPSESTDVKKRFINDANYEASLDGLPRPQSIHFTRAAKKRGLLHGSRGKACEEAGNACFLRIQVLNRGPGTPIFGAYVNLVGAPFSGVTDLWGAVYGWAIPAGAYNLKVTHECFTTVETPLTLEAGHVYRDWRALDQKPNSRFILPTGKTAGPAWEYFCESI